ncbi:MAG: hypothetical protein M9907_08660 [Burkholderiaceae bacterium]|nr:hypothetical protein [Burkholderiaceae bacterium]
MKTIVVTFTDSLSGRVVYTVGVESVAHDEAARCAALSAAYEAARTSGVTVNDPHLRHSFACL